MFDGLGIFAVLFFISILIFLPLFVTVVVGVAVANLLGFTGVAWWCFVILFYLVVTALISKAK